jgi:60 kDa SS-A/Ro ribonucleoprotein
LIIKALQELKPERVLPFRFIAAARYAPQWEPYLETAMLKCLETQDKLAGKTILLIDVSGSMEALLSAKSDITRMEAACGLAMLAREICEQIDVLTFSNNLVRIPARKGFALHDAIVHSQVHDRTYLGQAIDKINREETYNRIIVMTDEQSHDSIPAPKGKGYMINVACYQNGIGYGAWTHIDGWSESIIRYIQELEHS